MELNHEKLQTLIERAWDLHDSSWSIKSSTFTWVRFSCLFASSNGFSSSSPQMSAQSHLSLLYHTNLGLGYSIAVALGFLLLLSIILLVSSLYLGLGYSIAVALGFLLLLSIILLASYICCRPSSSPVRAFPPNPAAGSGGVILPRVIFIDEDDENVIMGLEEAVINSYPKFQELEMLRMMPECRHCFHVFCLDLG
ncbi:hypothetical protein F3Y22_tig00113337pilonHSYRG00112 [Hibiscus syriacus]|uniref:Uncharacterized protein n=1 Tax=Hibiscus syriacus TaxID=106335 RepID=A0A6A2Y2W6_HIBSY|nr:hypothetical protein F3Y22_tig00113337pilonHSYRG00112 [Hibiscus syriacus]